MKLLLKFHIAFVNGLRRSLISNIPSFSLNTKFIENETSYNNDILNLRFAMIPVKKHLSCRLEKTNETARNIIITSNDFENEHIMKDIFLFELKPNESIHIECETERGYGFQDARWQVIQTPMMKLIQEVVIKKHDIEKIKTIAPELITDGKLDKKKCLMDRTAVERLNQIDPIVFYKNSGEYELYFESDYYSEDYCLKQALSHLKQLFEKLEYEVIPNQNLTILKFHEKSFTFGNIIQYYLQKVCNFATLNKEHYLDNFVVLKFDEPISILEETRVKILEDLNHFEQFCIL